jgi:hypothetical protein
MKIQKLIALLVLVALALPMVGCQAGEDSAKTAPPAKPIDKDKPTSKDNAGTGTPQAPQ